MIVKRGTLTLRVQFHDDTGSMTGLVPVGYEAWMMKPSAPNTWVACPEGSVSLDADTSGIVVLTLDMSDPDDYPIGHYQFWVGATVPTGKDVGTFRDVVLSEFSLDDIGTALGNLVTDALVIRHVLGGTMDTEVTVLDSFAGISGSIDFTNVLDAIGQAGGRHTEPSGVFAAINDLDTGSVAGILTRVTALGTVTDRIEDKVDALAPAGPIVWAYEVKTQQGDPIADAAVWVCADQDGKNVVDAGRTDAFGKVSFTLEAGTYYVWRRKAGFRFDNPDTEVVSE